MSALVFWSCAAIVAWTFVGYPLVVGLRALLLPRPIRGAAAEPSVSLIICAFDEAASIGRRLENALELDYPRELLEILVASEGSTDGTQEIATGFAGRGVRLLDLPRRGKIPTLNAAVEAARHDILVFSDANSEYDRDALRELVWPLADPEVGAVAGDQRYRPKQGSRGDGSEGERAYWSFDRVLKRLQSRSGSVTSATGAIHAIRRELFSPVPTSVTDDFWVSTGALAEGRRLVFAPGAIAWEEVAASSGAEFERKVRVMTRGLRAVWLRRALLNPFRSGFYALQLFTHKVLRRLVALPVVAMTLASAFLLREDLGLLYGGVLASGLLLASAAALAAILGPRAARWKVLVIPHYFVMVNLAALRACYDLLRGRRIDSWVPARANSAATGASPGADAR